MTQGHLVMERLTRNAPLGIRFWDPVEQTSAIDGLKVEVFRAQNPATRVRAYPNPSGVYVAHTLPAFVGSGSPAGPGLRDFETSGLAPETLWTIETRPYRIEVTDPRGRFLPFAFDADLPARGLLTWLAPWLSPPAPVTMPGEEGSPPALMERRIPLFSAPSRPLPDPLAVVYAQLREDGGGSPASWTPAAWTPLSVSIDGVIRGLGLSDREGRVAVFFPYPEPPRMTLGSPPEARNDFTWEVELTAYGAPASPRRAVPPRAELAEILAALDWPRAVAGGPLVSPGAPLRLAYRQPLIARTPGATGEEASYLSISA